MDKNKLDSFIKENIIFSKDEKVILANFKILEDFLVGENWQVDEAFLKTLLSYDKINFMIESLYVSYCDRGQKAPLQNRVVASLLQVYSVVKEKELEVSVVKMGDEIVSDSVRLYFNDIAMYPKLTKEETNELFRRFNEDGDLEAKKRLIECNLRLVIYFVNKLCKDTSIFLDCIQEGNCGLIKAVEQYDYKKGFAFATYASNWIIARIKRDGLQNGNVNKIPQADYSLMAKVAETEANLRKNNDIVTYADIAKRMQMSENKIKKIKELENFRHPVSLNQVINNDGDGSVELGNLIADNSQSVEDRIISKEIAEYLLYHSRLTSRELCVILLRTGFVTGTVVPYKKIGKFLNVSHTRVQQMEKVAKDKIRRSAVAAGLGEAGIKTFYSCFKNTSKEDIIRAIEALRGYEKIELKEIIGEDLEMAIERPLSENQVLRIQPYISRIKKILKQGLPKVDIDWLLSRKLEYERENSKNRRR